MRRHLLVILLVLLSAVSASAKVYQNVTDVPNTRLQSSFIHISDPDDWITEGYEYKINSVLDSVLKISKADVFVVVLSSIGGKNIETFATDLFDYWGIGDAERNDGLLMLMVEDQHKLKFETGYGIESTLSDALCAKIFNQIIVPYFKKGEYNEGLYAGVCAVASELGYMPSDSKVTSSQMTALKRNNQDSQRGNNNRNTGKDETDDGLKTLLKWLLIIVSGALGVAFLIKLLMDGFVFLRSKKTARRQLKNGSVPVQKANQVFNEFWSVAVTKWTLFYFGYVSALRKMENAYLKKQMVCRCGHQMHLIPDAEADQYLEDDAVFEKKLGVVSLHVLQCTRCKKIKVVELFARKGYRYTYCPKCHCLTGEFCSFTLEDSPTYYSEGKGLNHYHCIKCDHYFTKTVILPKKSLSESRGFFSGGSDNDNDNDYSSSSSSSSNSGSFGGGSSGGGGYTGSW